MFAVFASSNPLFQSSDFASVHLREAEALLAEVFQRCADQIQLLVIDDEEAIVEGSARPDRQSAILRVKLRLRA